MYKCFAAILKAKKLKATKVEALKPKQSKQEENKKPKEDEEDYEDDDDEGFGLDDESSGDAEARDSGIGKKLIAAIQYNTFQYNTTHFNKIQLQYATI